MTSKFSGEL